MHQRFQCFQTEIVGLEAAMPLIDSVALQLASLRLVGRMAHFL